MRKARVDKNQPLIVAALRALGFLVQQSHVIGAGCPDLIVSGKYYGGFTATLLVELKCNDWTLSPYDPRWANTLTPDEQAWHIVWRHANVIVTNRLRWVLHWYGWSDGEIQEALDGLADDPGVRAALADVRRKGDGTVPGDVAATLEF